MPARTLSKCALPTCLALAIRRGRCAVHAQEADQSRGGSAARGYDREWRRLRARFLRERCARCDDRPVVTCECGGTGLANAFCRDCLRGGKIVLAREVHHVESVRVAPHRRLDATNLMGLCKPCHQKRTARGE